MNETVQKVIERSGAIWTASGIDHHRIPVLIRLPNDATETIYVLSLESGASHPFWTIRERQMTDMEAADLIEARRKARTFNPVFTADEKQAVIIGVMAWVKNGRTTDWKPHTVRADVELHWKQM